MTASFAYLPQVLSVGSGASKNLVSVLGDLDLKKPLIITDPFIVQCGYLERITRPLDQASQAYGLFSDCVPDPTTDSLEQALARWHSGDFDCVVALGGGSSIDTAKAVAVLAIHGGRMRDYKAPAKVPVGVPIIAIPTTAGTGSEATRVVVITDTETEEKMMCLGLGFMPSAAIIDYELTLSMPYRLTADTGIDSLCHAMEAYVSRKANSFSDSFALAAMAAITKHIRTACEQPENHAAREAMMLAAFQGGVAFSNASVTLIHAMSRPLGAFFHVPHGLSNAMLMPALTEYSISAGTARYADCARAMGFASQQQSNLEANQLLIENLYRLTEELSVPSPAAFGIDKQQYHQKIPVMAAQAIASGSHANNPKIPTQSEIEALYRAVWV